MIKCFLKTTCFFIIQIIVCQNAFSQYSLQNKYWKVDILKDGTISNLLIGKKGKWDTIALPQKKYAGFKWYVTQKGLRQNISLFSSAKNTFIGDYNGIKVSLEYALLNNKLIINASVTNNSGQIFAPEKLGLGIGVSNYMAKYPQWDNVYFPTLLRCEKTHFWGYLMNPNGNILGIASPDPIASWSLNYNGGYGDDWGHRIYSPNLDMINAGPLPERNPQNLSQLRPGDTKHWTIYLMDIASVNEVQKVLSTVCKAPMIELKQTTLEQDKPFEIVVDNNPTHKIIVVSPSGKIISLTAIRSKANQTVFIFATGKEEGVYTLIAKNNQKISEAKITIRKPWGWYLQKARDATMIYTQKASWNCENWYGFYSAYLAEQYYPDGAKLKQTDDRFWKVVNLMYDTTKAIPQKIINASRIQNTSTIIGILVDKFKAENRISDLILAENLANNMIMPSQGSDGAYYNGHTNYTSVIYIAKSMLELAAQEKIFGKNDNSWQRNYLKHYSSAKKAIDQLMLGVGAIETEGEGTYEDGMISCTALQIAAFALLQNDPKERLRYTKMAEEFVTGHRCLTQLIVPDSRQRNGTLRFWEAQYDVMLGNNMISSPHGWSAWTAYATYYLYLLTGKQDYLIQTMNSLGSCVQTIDTETGNLRWAFVVDPYINTVQLNENFPNSDPNAYNNNQFSAEEGKTKTRIIGEQYVDMVADWFNGNSSDNDVHEIFKCMEEVAVGKAYVLERSDGNFLAYNCTVTKKGNKLTINSNDDRLFKVHLNTKHKYKVMISNWTKQISIAPGMSWLNKL